MWVGGGTIAQFFAQRAIRTRDADRMADISGDIEWIGMRVLLLASLTALLVGIGLVWESPAWGFGDDWIVIGFILFGVTFISGLLYFGPESGRIAKLLETEGSESPQVQARIRRILMLGRIDLIVLFLIVFDMTVKPSFSDGWTILLALAAAVALAAMLTLGRAHADAPATVAADR